MAGAKNNTVTYVFEGDTLNLEQAIKRVQSLMRGTVKTLKEQEGGMSEVQKAQYKQLRSLMKTIKELNEKGSSITEDEQKKLNNAMKKALSISNRLYQAKLREKDKIRAREIAKERKEKAKAEKEAEDIEFAKTPEAQVRAHSQIQQLSRLKGFMNADDPAEREAIQNLDAVIVEYNRAKQAYDEGKGSMEQLAKATVELDKKYKELAGSLNRLSSEQNKANHGEGKASFLQYVFGKAKSLTVYKLIKAVLAKIAQAVQKAFQKIAQANKPFNEAMSKITSSFQLLADKIATVLAPVLQILAPILEGIVQLIGTVTDKLAEMFSAVAGNDEWAQATEQVEDYAAATKKAKQPEGIDELNKLNTEKNNIVNVEISDKFKDLKNIGEEIKNVFESIMKTLQPVMEAITGILESVFTLIGAIVTGLQPLLNIITTIVSFLGGAIGGVLSFLVNNILVPIINYIALLISHMEFLLPLLISFVTIWTLMKWSSIKAGLVAIITSFKAMAVSIWNAILAAKNWIIQSIKTVAQNIKTAISTWIAEKAYWKLALAVIAAAGFLAAVVAGIVITATAIAASSTNKYQGNEPHMATGGIVNEPTLAMVGEGKYPEAVVPLGQSPQFKSMKEGIASEVVNIIGGRGSSNKPVILQLNGRELARAILPDLQLTLPQTGVKLT